MTSIDSHEYDAAWWAHNATSLHSIAAVDAAPTSLDADDVATSLHPHETSIGTSGDAVTS